MLSRSGSSPRYVWSTVVSYSSGLRLSTIQSKFPGINGDFVLDLVSKMPEDLQPESITSKKLRREAWESTWGDCGEKPSTLHTDVKRRSALKAIFNCVLAISITAAQRQFGVPTTTIHQDIMSIRKQLDLESNQKMKFFQWKKKRNGETSHW